MKNKLNVLFMVLLIILILISNYYYISFPTIFDTFTYLSLDSSTRASIHYITTNLIIGNIDSIFLNTFLTYVWLLIFLIICFLLKKELFWNNKKSFLIYFIIFGVFLLGSYRFFVWGFMQILIFIWLILSLYLQIKYEKLKQNKYLFLNYIYIFFLATINDFWIFLLAFNFIYNLKFLLKNKFIIFSFIIWILAWWILFYLVKNNIYYIEYPTDWKAKLFYNVFFNPFVWWPGKDFFNELKLLLWWWVLSYIFLALLILWWYFYKWKWKYYIIWFIIFYSIVLLLLPKAPSFNRYMSYFYPFVGILVISYIVNKFYSYKLFFTSVIILLFISQINADKINNSFLDWNNNGRYWLEYKIAKDYICKHYQNEKIYWSYSSAFILWYTNWWCKKNNLFDIWQDFYNWINPVETIINNNINLFIYSRIIEWRFQFDEYLKPYLTQNITLNQIPLDSEMLSLFWNYVGSNWRFWFYNIWIENPWKYENILSNKNTDIFYIPKNIEKFYITVVFGWSNDTFYIEDLSSNKKITINNFIHYNELDWSKVVIPIERSRISGENIRISSEGLGYIEGLGYTNTHISEKID